MKADSTVYLIGYEQNFVYQGTGYRCSLDSTLSGPPKKGGIFGGKNKINDPFFIGPSPGPSMDENVPQVAQEAGVVRWKGNHTPFTLTVGNPEKSSKLGGMKDWLNIHPLRDNFQKISVNPFLSFRSLSNGKIENCVIN